MSHPPVEPTEAPSERQGLEEFLDYYREVMRRKVIGLDAAALNRTVAASSLTLGGIIKHLSLVEEQWFVEDILGQELSELWAAIDWEAEPEWDFESAANDTPEQLLALHARRVSSRGRSSTESMTWTPSQRASRPLEIDSTCAGSSST